MRALFFLAGSAATVLALFFTGVCPVGAEEGRSLFLAVATSAVTVVAGGISTSAAATAESVATTAVAGTTSAAAAATAGGTSSVKLM